MANSTALSILVGMGALRSNPLRSILSTLGVIIGVASLVAILSIGDSLERFSRDQIVQTTDLQSMWVASRTSEVVDGIRIDLEDPVRFTGQDFVDLSLKLGDDAVVVPIASSSARAKLPVDTTTVVVLVTETIAEALPRFNDGLIAYGRFIGATNALGSPVLENRGADKIGTREAVLSKSLAGRLANGKPDSLLIGEVVLVGEIAYNVVGILGGDEADSPRLIADINAGSSFGSTEAFPRFSIRAEKIELVEPLMVKIQSWLNTRFEDSERRFTVSASQERVEQVAQGMLVFKLGLGAIAAISLIVGGIGIMNVLLASVAERTREIGVRKATGAKKSDILIQFLAESVSITGFGALLGTLLGLVASAGIMIGIKAFTGAPVGVTYTWLSIVLAAVAAIVIGLLFGMFPAVRASRLSPVDAIRHE